MDSIKMSDIVPFVRAAKVSVGAVPGDPAKHWDPTVALRVGSRGDSPVYSSQDINPISTCLQEVSMRDDHNNASSSTLGNSSFHDPLLPRDSRETVDGIHGNDEGTAEMVPQIQFQGQPRRRRILDRDAAFRQSRGRWRVRHVSRGHTRQLLLDEQHDDDDTTASVGGFRRPQRRCESRGLGFFIKRLWGTWFYTLAYQKTVVLCFILFCAYACLVAAFASVYLALSILGQKTVQLDPDNGNSTAELELFCQLDIHDHMQALYFSLSTMTTIGYGVSDYNFGGCWTPLLLVLAQVCCAIVLDAVAIGLIFQRISRGNKRAKTILFSDKAVIRRVQSQPHLYFRVAELRHHHLLEATVRAYCIQHERTIAESGAVETTHYVTKPLRLGDHNHPTEECRILMSLPQVLTHSLDYRSPLFPTEEWYDADGHAHLPIDSSSDANVDALAEFFLDRETEIVVLLEGTDETTGTTLQTRHSYTCEDLLWNCRFRQCIFPNSEDHVAQRRPRLTTGTSVIVDFSRFHEAEPVADPTAVCPFVATSDNRPWV